MTLLIHELLHLFVGLVIAISHAKLVRSWSIAPWILLPSLLIDIDHTLDYLLTIGPHWDAKAFATGSYFVTSGRVIVLLHSWELAIVLAVTSRLLPKWKWSLPLLGVSLGMLGHLLVDQIWYEQPLGTYFLIVRWFHGFADPLNW